MNSYIDVNKLRTDAVAADRLGKVCKRYKNHEFDLLGSDYVRFFYGMRAKGAYGHKYVSKSDNVFKRIAKFRLKGICGESYEPINWYIDYKSGYSFDPVRYRSRSLCLKSIGKYAGVDIKCPWELGRLYHLPQLAIMAVFDMEAHEWIAREYRDEVLDFIYMNPVGKTVQWSCPMDASIRIVNLTVSYDILRQVDDSGVLDNRFHSLIKKNIRDSLDYLMSNLEFAGKGSTNHYLSNIVGIIYASAYLPSTDWTDACLAFGA